MSLRKNRGSVLAEFGAGTVMFTMIMVAFVMLFVNIYAYISFSEKLKQAANAAAQVYAQQNLLYGCMIVGNETQLRNSEEHAKQVANRIMDELGVPRNRQIQLDRLDPESTPKAFVARCRISANGIPWPYQAPYLPGAVNVEYVSAVGLGPIRLARIAGPDFNQISSPRPLSQEEIVAGIQRGTILQSCINVPVLTSDVDRGNTFAVQFPNHRDAEHGDILGINGDPSAYVRIQGAFSTLQNQQHGMNISPGQPESYSGMPDSPG
jgi:hypothetical protein